jgi:hypothetical protein
VLAQAASGTDVVPDGSWVAAMRAGDFDRAWALTDRDLATLREGAPGKHEGPRHLQRIWRGEDLGNKRVLVRCYHGLGDTIQFARFMPQLRAIAKSVSVWCQPQLLPLMQRVVGVDHVSPLHDGAPEVDFDVDIEIMEIPHAIRAGKDQIAMRRPYLSLPPQKPGPALLGEDLNVGLVWEGGDWDRRRAIPVSMLRRLDFPGIKLYSFQRGPQASRCAEIGADDVSTPDICTLGHLVRRMDVVISVDTMLAHLAGALGCKGWVLLHADCDWRWPAPGAKESVWYPTLRLFHQKSPGDWSEAIEDVRDQLIDWAARKRHANLTGSRQADATL